MSLTVAKTIRRAAFGTFAILAAAGSAHAIDITGAPAPHFQTRSIKNGPRPIRPRPATRSERYPIGPGLGAGINQIKANTVDFGATDKPLKPDVAAAGGFVQFPAVIGGVVPVINLPGIKPGEIVLDGATAGPHLYGNDQDLGRSRSLKAANPKVKLPSAPITVVHRSDGSGTTFNFATYLSNVDADWQAKVGANTAVEWPAGVGGKGNEGVSALVGANPRRHRLRRICLRAAK